MRAPSSLFSQSPIPLTSLQLSRLFHQSISSPSPLRTMAPSLLLRYCPTAGSYSPAPHFRDQTTYSSSARSMSSKRTLPRVTSRRQAHLNKSPGSARKRWWERHCIHQRTFTSKEPKGSRCTGLLSSRTGGRRATRESGQDSCSSTEACPRCLRVQRAYTDESLQVLRACGMIGGPRGGTRTYLHTRVILS